MQKTVGSFTYDSEAGTISGPESFMRSAEWSRTQARIASGSDVVLRECLVRAPDAYTGLLVFVQTVYAGWHGMETFNASRGI
jgi:hypothetical protein